MAKNNLRSDLPARTLTAARIHFYFILAFTASIIIFDAWNLVTPEIILRRWTMAALLLVIATAVWYASRSPVKKAGYFRGLLASLILADVVFASLLVYIERGMASRAVMLYALPIVISGLIRTRRAIFGTAFICMAAYVFTAVRYFVVNFNEGYKIELYGILGFYSAMFFVLAAAVWAISGTNKQSR